MSDPLRILHLSDLHIPEGYTNDQDFRTIKLNLIKDISRNRKKFGAIDIAVFTGDFTDKGYIELFQKELIEFINEVLKAADIPKQNTVFVPGNHDAKRPTGMVLDQIQKVREKCEVTSNKDDVEYLCKRFQHFTEFYSDILGDSAKSIKSYGVKDISVGEDVYRFIRLNSALATFDKNDYNNLFVTKVQLDNILAEMNEQVNPRITFLVMHHPMDWLTYEERLLLEEYVTDTTKFNVDIILNGHIHNGQVSLNSDLDTNVITLVSGVGYSRVNRGASVYPDLYRYAIYTIDPNQNKLEGALRISNQKKVFGPDRTLYKKINNDGILSIPLKIDYGLSIRQLKIPMDTQIVINDKLLEALDNVISNLWKFEQQSKQSISNIASKKRRQTKNSTKKEQVDKVQVFLFDFCCTFKTIFFPYVNSKDIRVHVRYYVPSENVHRVITSMYGDKTQSESVTDMKWRDKKNLIYYSYIEKRALLASLNPEMAYRSKDSRWDEFMTLAVTYSSYNNQEIPAMSFGVSFDWTNMEDEMVSKITNTLYCLSYVGVEHVMENIIEYASVKLKFKDFFDKIGGEYAFGKRQSETNQS